MYSPQALWSAAHQRARVAFFVFNNRRYGVLQNVARQLGCANALAGRFVGMEVTDPPIDFLALAASMGVPAERADSREAIAAAAKKAFARPGPTLIEIPVQVRARADCLSHARRQGQAAYRRRFAALTPPRGSGGRFA